MNPVDQANTAFALINLAVLSEHGRDIVKQAMWDQTDAGFQNKKTEDIAADAAGARKARKNVADTVSTGAGNIKDWLVDKIGPDGPDAAVLAGSQDADTDAAMVNAGSRHGGAVGMGLGGALGAAGGAGLAKLTAGEDEEEGTTKKRMALAAIAAGVPLSLVGGWLGNEFGDDAMGALANQGGDGEPGSGRGKGISEMLQQQFGVGVPGSGKIGDQVGGYVDSAKDTAGAIGDSLKSFHTRTLEEPIGKLSAGAGKLKDLLMSLFQGDGEAPAAAPPAG